MDESKQLANLLVEASFHQEITSKARAIFARDDLNVSMLSCLSIYRVSHEPNNPPCKYSLRTTIRLVEK